MSIPDVGHFLFMMNGSVKCRYMDRTILSFIYPPPCEIRIMSNRGENIKFEFNPKVVNNEI